MAVQTFSLSFPYILGIHFLNDTAATKMRTGVIFYTRDNLASTPFLIYNYTVISIKHMCNICHASFYAVVSVDICTYVSDNVGWEFFFVVK